LSESAPSGEKTEEPTPKKIEDARAKGNIPLSRELTMFASLASILVSVTFLFAGSATRLGNGLGQIFDGVGDISIGAEGDAGELLSAIGHLSLVCIGPIIAVIALSGIAAVFIQSEPRLIGERVRPQLSRISPKAGLKRIFGSQGAVEFVRSLFKFGAVGLICAIILKNEFGGMVNAIFVDPVLLPAQVLSAAGRLLSAICVATIALVAGDLAWSHFKWRHDLKMTRQEVKDEHKQIEGDPMVKARLRSLASDRSRRRMLSQVPTATVVIANPTHYAIALSYKRDRGGAPIVLAKGKDLVALKIREIAEMNKVPVIEDPALARALFDAVQLDQMIPPEFYRAVAGVLSYLTNR